MKKETLKKRKEALKKGRKHSKNEEGNTEKKRKETFYKKIG